MPKRPSGSVGMYNAQIMAAKSYVPKARPYNRVVINYKK